MSQSHLHKLLVLINTDRMSIIPFKNFSSVRNKLQLKNLQFVY